jgi:hypothetical protein
LWRWADTARVWASALSHYPSLRLQQPKMKRETKNAKAKRQDSRPAPKAPPNFAAAVMQVQRPTRVAPPPKRWAAAEGEAVAAVAPAKQAVERRV